MTISVERGEGRGRTDTIVSEQVLPDEGQAALRISITLPSFTVTKSKNGYTVTPRTSGAMRHLGNCSDLWDVANNLQHHLHLTPTVLAEIQSFHEKCAELHWDDAAVAGYYSGAAQAAGAAILEK